MIVRWETVFFSNGNFRPRRWFGSDTKLLTFKLGFGNRVPGIKYVGIHSTIIAAKKSIRTVVFWWRWSVQIMHSHGIYPFSPWGTTMVAVCNSGTYLKSLVPPPSNYLTSPYPHVGWDCQEILSWGHLPCMYGQPLPQHPHPSSTWWTNNMYTCDGFCPDIDIFLYLFYYCWNLHLMFYSDWSILFYCHKLSHIK